LLLAAIQRVCQPGPKTEVSAWYRRTILHWLWGFAPERFTSQAFWDCFDRIQATGSGENDPDRAQLRLLGLWKRKQLVSQRLRLLLAAVGEEILELIDRRLAPVRDLNRMNPKMPGQLVHRLLAADRFHRHPRLKLRAVLLSRRRHQLSLVNDSAENSNLLRGPKIGVHYSSQAPDPPLTRPVGHFPSKDGRPYLPEGFAAALAEGRCYGTAGGSHPPTLPGELSPANSCRVPAPRLG
jgi:hypothetical protein